MVIKKSKKAWIRLVEVFVALLLIVGVVMVILQKGNKEKSEVPTMIHNFEISILRDIQYNQTLRNEILDDQDNFPIAFENISEIVRNKIKDRTPNNFACSAMICGVDKYAVCDYPTRGSEMYAQEVFISATLNNYAPRKLKLFCRRLN